MAYEADLYPDEYFEGLHRVTPFAAPQRKWRERTDILRLSPSREKVVLDLGSARGDVCFQLAPLVQQAVGIDASPAAVEIAEAERARRGLENVRFVRGDVAELAPIADASIDVAGAFDLLEHVDDETVRQMLRALTRVLRPGGFFAAYTPNREHYVERLKRQPSPEAVLRAHRRSAAPRHPPAPCKRLAGARMTYSPPPSGRTGSRSSSGDRPESAGSSVIASSRGRPTGID
jgi:SAM-dependent methyltransferase